jgi:hypothetical protein
MNETEIDCDQANQIDALTQTIRRRPTTESLKNSTPKIGMKYVCYFFNYIYINYIKKSLPYGERLF